MRWIGYISAGFLCKQGDCQQISTHAQDLAPYTYIETVLYERTAPPATAENETSSNSYCNNALTTRQAALRPSSSALRCACQVALSLVTAHCFCQGASRRAYRCVLCTCFLLNQKHQKQLVKKCFPSISSSSSSAGIGFQNQNCCKTKEEKLQQQQQRICSNTHTMSFNNNKRRKKGVALHHPAKIEQPQHIASMYNRMIP